MENKIVELLKKPKEKQEVFGTGYNRLYPTGSSSGISYALCKIQKSTVDDVLPFRPILSAIETVRINTQNFSYDLFWFCEELKHFDTNLIMASFDVGSVFSNIPLQETTALCVQKLFEDKIYINGLSKTIFVKY